MLWRFRKELILIFFIVISLILIHERGFFYKKEKSISFPIKRNISVENLLREKNQLEGLLDLQKRPGFSHIIYATVVEISPWVFPSVIKIDKGSSSGVQQGMTIINSSGYLIGRVTRVFYDYAIGVTLFNKENRVSTVISSTGEIGVMEGGDFPYIKIKFLPPEPHAKNGDIVQTSGYTQLFPSDIVIGQIVKIFSSNNNLVTEALVAPFFYYSGFENVALIKK